MFERPPRRPIAAFTYKRLKKFSGMSVSNWWDWRTLLGRSGCSSRSRTMEVKQMETVDATSTMSSRHAARRRRPGQRIACLVTFSLLPDDVSTLTRYAARREMKPHRLLRHWVEERLDIIRRDVPFIDDEPM